jgi:hypothetical protein
MKIRIFRGNGDGLPEQIHGDVMAARLRGDESQQIDNAGMARLYGQNLPVEHLGLGPPARLMVLQGKVKGLGGSKKGHWGSSHGAMAADRKQSPSSLRLTGRRFDIGTRLV